MATNLLCRVHVARCTPSSESSYFSNTLWPCAYNDTLTSFRCAALDLKLSRSQKKLIKCFNRFIVNGERRKWHNKGTSETMKYTKWSSCSCVWPLILFPADPAVVREKEETRFECEPEKSIKCIKEISFERAEPANQSSGLVNTVPETPATEKTTNGAFSYLHIPLR